jgi:transcriptional regulator with XRE-family HTH domain
MEKEAFNKLFGQYVKRLRNEKGWTQVQLSDKLNSDFQYISSLERGEFAPTVYWVYNLTKAFEVEFKVFMTGLDDFMNSEKM